MLSLFFVDVSSPFPFRVSSRSSFEKDCFFFFLHPFCSPFLPLFLHFLIVKTFKLDLYETSSVCLVHLSPRIPLGPSRWAFLLLGACLGESELKLVWSSVVFIKFLNGVFKVVVVFCSFKSVFWVSDRVLTWFSSCLTKETPFIVFLQGEHSMGFQYQGPLTQQKGMFQVQKSSKKRMVQWFNSFFLLFDLMWFNMV